MERHLNLLSRTFFHCSAAALLLLAGCGGGGEGNNNSPPANSAARTQGAYEGTLGGAALLPNFQLLLLEDGTYYTLAGTGTGSAFTVEGFIEGSGTETDSAVDSTSTQFMSNNARDFSSQPPTPFSFSATTVINVGITGGFYASGGVNVQLIGAPISTTLYDYNAAAQLSDVVGSWDFSAEGQVEVTLTISSNGTYSGTDVDGCSSSGTLTPRPSGKNVFNVTYLDGPAPCPEPGLSATGVAFVTTPASGPRRLYLMGTTPNRSEGFAVFGTPTPP